ncbi:hypothetical protein KEM54_005151 [Ascosphaera aggregata]|nr:hypothetical protein KEM54_005151 [Ascosphaera aggregata]
MLQTAAATTTNHPLLAVIDTASQISQSVFLAESGVTGLVLLGSTGEAIHLSRSERFDVVKSVKDGLIAAGYPHFPIMAGVLVDGVEEARQWLIDLICAGASYGLVLIPGYFGGATSQEGIIRWVEAVVKDSPLPVVLYNYPGVTNGVVVAPETYRRLARLFNVVGVKMSHANSSHHLQVSLDPEIDHSKFKVYSGLRQHSAGITLFKCSGVVDGLAAFYPKTCIRLSQLAQDLSGSSGQDSSVQALLFEMQKLQYAVCRGCEFISKYGVIGMKEMGSRVTGFGDAKVGRAPLLGGLSDEQWKEGMDVYLKYIEETENELQ